MVSVAIADYASFRIVARRLLAEDVEPNQVLWHSADGPSMLPLGNAESRGESSSGGSGGHAAAAAGGRQVRVPRVFHSLGELVACHRRADKWHALYRLLWVLVHEGRELIDDDARDEVRVVKDLAAQVRRDEHKMRAFVRFVPVTDDAGERYVAWYEPDHLIVRLAAPFFADRFSGMPWSILTPDLSAHWREGALTFSPGVPAALRPHGDSVAQLWRVYYESVFNPARLNTRAMLREMPLRKWRNLPEAEAIPGLLHTARERTVNMAKKQRATEGARPFVPQSKQLEVLRDAADDCRGCDLYKAATQAVFGEGPRKARVMLVGEQPGDEEDVTGKPFVGPAGKLLDRALAEAGVDREKVYVTNAVKHFSFEPRGKRRIHKTPRQSEMYACRPWLEAEIRSVAPQTIVVMGATAARALLGPQARVTTLRGRVLEGLPWAPRVIATIHPSAALRADTPERREQYFEWLVSDLRLALDDGSKS